MAGKAVRVTAEEAARQAAELAASGVEELTVTGIELASYQYGLGKLVQTLHAAAPGLRLRLGSLEPRVVDEAFCRQLADTPGLCPHFHLSLQSGCDKTLKEMNRKYTTDD